MSPSKKTRGLRPQRSGLLRHRLLISTAVVVFVSGCAATPAGSVGAEAFSRDAAPVQLTGPRNASEAALCFEEQGRFLPLSEFSNDSAAGRYTYRLRIAELWFEQVRITPDGSGSRAEWRLAPNLDARWRAQFERDRLAPLRTCLGV